LKAKLSALFDSPIQCPGRFFSCSTISAAAPHILRSAVSSRRSEIILQRLGVDFFHPGLHGLVYGVLLGQFFIHLVFQHFGLRVPIKNNVHQVALIFVLKGITINFVKFFYFVLQRLDGIIVCNLNEFYN
jgi:hypothetical protein